MKKLFYTFLLLFFLLIPSLSWSATYNYYFSDDATGNAEGSDSNDCSSGSPCKSLSKAQALIDAATSSDTVNIYLDRSDTWSYSTNANVLTTVFALNVTDTDPEVHIDAYGSGNKPIIDGGISDFSDPGVLDHDPTFGNSGCVDSCNNDGPVYWSVFIQLEGDGHSVKNLHLQNAFGRGINVLGSEDAEISNCEFNNFGYSTIVVQDTTKTITVDNIHIVNNLIHETALHYVHDSAGLDQSGWPANIVVGNEGWAYSVYTNTYVAYNVIYNVGGEGIAVWAQRGTNNIIEYNIVGDTGAGGVQLVVGGKGDAGDIVARYNYIISSSSSTYNGSIPATTNMGIIVLDEHVNVDGGDGACPCGDNSDGSVEVYGNVVINRSRGIWMTNLMGDTSNAASALGSLKVYNNTFVDCSLQSFALSRHNSDTSDNVDAAYFYNNASIFYDRTPDPTGATDPKHTANWSALDEFEGFTIENNSYWPVSTSCDADANPSNDWDANCVDGDPELEGEEQGSPIDWDGQAGATYYKDIDFDMLYPRITSSLVAAGKTLSGYEQTFLTLGTDFAVLPATVTMETAEMSDLSAWDIGAVIRSLSYDMSPVDGASGISTTVDLNWTNQTDTTGVDVYFDSGSCPIGVPTKVVDNLDVETYDPGTLNDNTTYCYTVDPHNSLSQTEAGLDIEFTTTTGPPPPTTSKSSMVYDDQGAAIVYDDQGMSLQ